jgi:hypothetical protein
MARKKNTRRERLYTFHIQTKVNEKAYRFLEQTLAKSDCLTIAELVRRILSREEVIIKTCDASMDGIMEELIGIRIELKGLGVNVNQIKHHFHLAPDSERRLFHAIKVGEQYTKVGNKVDELLDKVAMLTQKWLQK